MEPTMAAHVVIFPFMAQGHTLPLLDLSKALSRQQIKVTVITTPSNAKSISKYINYQSHVDLVELEFPSVHGLPDGCENTSQLPSMEYFLPFASSTKQLQKPFQQVLKRLVESEMPPICVISDFFLGWTLSVCQEFGVPRLVFHGMGVLSMAIVKAVWVHAPQLKVKAVTDPLDLPGMNLPFTLTTLDLPLETINAPNQDDPFTKFIEEIGQAEVNSWGVIVNSFEELEHGHIPTFESFYMNGAKAWCLGPLFLYNDRNESVLDHKSMITQWLSEQAPESVIYVAFGTQAGIPEAQLDELAFGLESSGFPFIWVVRSTTWKVPSSIQESIKRKGLILTEWVDQKKIISHRAIGGFLSHCGWNSLLESLASGVPILAWPMIAEQSLNAKLIVDGLGAGVSVERVQLSPGDNILVPRRAICEGVRVLMGGEKGRNARERAQALGRVAGRGVQKGGSSHNALFKLIGQLLAR